MSTGQSTTKKRAATHSRPQSHINRSKFLKPARWAIGILLASILTVVGTVVIPDVGRQVVSGSRIEDYLRSGPDIITSESLFYLDGPGTVPTVAAGNYQPSVKLVRELARPGAVALPSVERQIVGTGGVQAQDIFIRLVLQGNRNQRILVLNIRPVQIRRSRPLNGVLFDVYGQAGTPDIFLGLDLDEPIPTAVVAHYGELTRMPYFASRIISLNNGEQSVVMVDAETKCYSAQFKLELDYLADGRNAKAIISNHGQPFKVTAYRFNNRNAMSYRRIFALNQNFSATQPSRFELAHEYSRTAQEGGGDSCLS